MLTDDSKLKSDKLKIHRSYVMLKSEFLHALVPLYLQLLYVVHDKPVDPRKARQIYLPKIFNAAKINIRCKLKK